MLTDALFEDGLPRDELEAQSVLDHGEAPADEGGDARQPPGHIFPRPAWHIGQAALGRHLPANVIDLLPFKRGDGLARDGNRLPAVRGVAHLHQPLGTPIEGTLYLLAEPRLGQRCPFVGDKLPIQPGRAVAADLPFKVEGRERADGEVLGSPRRVMGGAALGDVGGNFPVIGVDALDIGGGHGSG